jgi:hypothetical protein
MTPLPEWPMQSTANQKPNLVEKQVQIQQNIRNNKK